MSTPLGLGVRVVRGPDWKWGDQDGGEGFTGTVVEICGPNGGNNSAAGGGGGVKPPDNTVILQWDGGSRTNYRIGHQNAFDLRVIDNAAIGVRHANICCKTCGNNSLNNPRSSEVGQQNGIYGLRWNCSGCADVDLCTNCYMGDRHDVTHAFWRLDRSSESSGVLMNPRKGSRKVPLKGIYPGAKVKRGHDWTWDDQDGGVGKVGKVHDIQGWDEESGRSVASVTWSATNITNIYRVGHRGKVDLECIQGGAGINGTYYPDHLPVLGRLPPVTVVLENAKPFKQIHKVEEKPHFTIGDRVEVNVPIETLKQLQDGHGGFNPRMSETLGKTGVVHRITNNGDIRVQYPGNPEQNFRWTLNPAALLRVTSFKPGDFVRILDNVASLIRLQTDHGEWTANMKDAAGKTGRVVKVYADGDVRVSVIGNTWTFNPASLRAVTGSQTQLNNTNVHEANDQGRYQGAAALSPTNGEANQLSHDVAKIQLEQIVTDASNGNTDAIRKRLTSSSWKKNSRNCKAVRAALLTAAKNGHLDVVRIIIEHFPEQIDLKSDGKTALHVSASLGQIAIIAFLLEFSNCANIDIRDDDGDSPLHYAAFGKQVATMEYLISRGADVNALNAKRCSVLHVATVMKDVDAVSLLIRQTSIDVNVKDSYGDAPLHEAIVKEDPAVLNLLCNVPAIDFSAKNRRGFNCLQYAALKGNLPALKMIIGKARQLVEVKKDDGFSPLLLASLNGHSECVRILLDEGKAVPDIADNRGQTALHAAVHQGHAAVIETLISRLEPSVVKRLINKEDCEGETSLHVALSREGDPPIPLSPETAPLTFSLAEKAEKFGVPKKLVHAISVATLLVLKGGKLNIKNIRGHAPINHVIDPMAKAFLLDSATQQQSSRKSSAAQASAAAALAAAEPLPPPTPKVPSPGHVECRICCDTSPNVTFEPCGHRIVCVDCSKRIKKCLECGIVIANKLYPCAQAEDSLKPDQIIHVLEAKVQEMEDRFMCTICMERNKEIAFLCGHSTCHVCADDLRACHMCRAPVTKKIFLESYIIKLQKLKF